MEDFKTQAIAICGAALTAGIAYLAAVIRNKILNSREKVQKPMIEALDNALNADFLLPILRNIYQTFTKKLADEEWTLDKQKEAVNKAYESLINQLPKYLIKIAKTLYPSVEVALKEKIQIFYEANKNKINVDIDASSKITNNTIIEE